MGQRTMVVKDPPPQPLLTPKSATLALSPPRAPPVGTVHRNILLGRRIDPTLTISPVLNTRHHNHHALDIQDDFHHHDEEHPTRRAIRHEQQRARLQEQLFLTRQQQNHLLVTLPHPHLSSGPGLADQTTRLLGTILPIPFHNYLRDSGTFRSICDTLVPASAPFMAFSNPAIIPIFLKLTHRMMQYAYGTHPRQYVQCYLPDTISSGPTAKPPALYDWLVFVHGGAWGSGCPWMYRLVAKPFIEKGMAVAIVGYRTYPCAKHIQDQVDDCRCALKSLFHSGDGQIHQPRSISLMGHSSGAHVALLLLVEMGIDPNIRSDTPTIQQFIGLSGPYNISHHFDYEAARGVEEISPMKAICGYSRTNLLHHSPAISFQRQLAKTVNQSSTPTSTSSIHTTEYQLCQSLPARILLVHGIEDETVPFTATAEAAHSLQMCGVAQCDELYLPKVCRRCLFCFV